MELIQMLDDKIKCDSRIRMSFSGLIPTTSELYNDAMNLAAAKKVYNQMYKNRFTMQTANYSMWLLYNLWKERYHPEVSQLYIRTEIVNQVRKFKAEELQSLQQGHRARLRKKFTDGQLADYEILELLLTYAIPRRDVRNLSRQLYKKYDRWFVSKRHYKVYPSDIDDMYYIQVEGICGRITTIV